jgi:hypothetical protein
MSKDEWISAEFERLAEVIHLYDSYLVLEMVPPEFHDELLDKSKVTRIVDARNNKVVMHAGIWDKPEDILSKLLSMDTGKGNVLNRLDAHNEAVKLLKIKKEADERAEIMEFTQFVLKNKKSRWEHNGKVYNEDFRNLGPKRIIIT